MSAATSPEDKETRGLRVAVFGLGYVGTVTAACLAANGHDVRGVDRDTVKVDLVSNGRSPVVEPGVDDLVRSGADSGALSATTKPIEALDGADVSLICVGTPSAANGAVDLSYLLNCVAEVADCLADQPADAGFHALIVRSTVPPGTVLGPVRAILEERLGPLAHRVGVGMCPEFLREGSGVADFADPPFTVLGTTDPRVQRTVEALFAFLDRPLRVVAVETAEGLKYACNAFHAAKVSFTNELSRLYRVLGVDARTVMEIFCEDDRLNISPSYLRPGFAFGGSCLPKDLRSLLHLARMNSIELPLLTGAMASNEHSIDEVVNRTVSSGGRKVALLGLSFKAQTDDLRESPNVRLAETLLGKGFELGIYDPIIQPSRLIGANRTYVEARLPHLHRLLAESPQAVLAGADVAIASTNQSAVVDALLAASPKLVIDLDGRLGDAVESLSGYEGIGW
jgi:GDP-mannose 6-dehydrogenase